MTSPSVMTINNGFRNSMNCEAKKNPNFFLLGRSNTVLKISFYHFFKNSKQIEKIENDLKIEF